MTKHLKALLLFLFLFQVIMASCFELAHDEAYYWLYSRNLAWGYFDHPPFVGMVIRLFSFFPHSELGVRIGFILLQFGTLGLILKMLPDTKYYFRTTLLFFAFPLASVSGLLALPDMPLLFMSAAYLLGLKIFLEKDNLKNSIGLGIIIALLFYAKYHGVLLVFFTLLSQPRLLIRKNFYVVAAVALLCFMPHICWQYSHEFSTLRYHFIERPKANFSIGRIFEYLGSNLIFAGLFAGPVVWWIVFKFKTTSYFEKSLKWISFGTIIFFLISSFSKRIEANWTIFLAPSLILLAITNDIWRRVWVKRLLWSSFIIVMTARLIFVFPHLLKRSSEFHGWKSWAAMVKSRCPDGTLMANTYQVASKLSFYLNEEVHSLNLHSRKNQFDYWRFDLRSPIGKVCYLTNQNGFKGEPIKTPEGKDLTLVTSESHSALLELKGMSI